MFIKWMSTSARSRYYSRFHDHGWRSSSEGSDRLRSRNSYEMLVRRRFTVHHELYIVHRPHESAGGHLTPSQQSMLSKNTIWCDAGLHCSESG